MCNNVEWKFLFPPPQLTIIGRKESNVLSSTDPPSPPFVYARQCPRKLQTTFKRCSTLC